MSCENPLVVINPRYKKMSFSHLRSYCNTYFGGLDPPDYCISVPCGLCHSCERDRMRSYMIRLLYELHEHPDSLFITLTFNDISLNEFREAPNKAVRLFLDRCRKSFGKSIRHWIVPEYGSLRGRIHYHGILFGVSNFDFAHRLSKLWSYGFIYVGYANDKTARYITKYITKSLSRPYSRDNPRIISSKGIGLSYLSEENVLFHRSASGVLRPYISFSGLKVPLPRYYYNKIFDSEDKLQLLLDRFLNPPTVWHLGSEVFYSEGAYINARKSLFLSRLNSGLSFDYNALKLQKKRISNLIYDVEYSNPKEFC